MMLSRTQKSVALVVNGLCIPAVLLMCPWLILTLLRELAYMY
jgi:hypothetical protein